MSTTPTDDPGPSLTIELTGERVAIVFKHPEAECKAVMHPDEAIRFGNRLVAIGRAAGGKSDPVMRGPAAESKPDA